MKVRALVKVQPGQRQPLGATETHRLHCLQRRHAELAVFLARLSIGVRIDGHAGPHPDPQVGQLGQSRGAAGDAIEFGQVVDDDDPAVAQSRVQVLVALVDAMHQDALTGHARRHGHADLAGPGAIQPEALALRPLGNGLAEKRLAGIGHGRPPRIVRGKRTAILLGRGIERGGVEAVEGRAVFVRQRVQVAAANGEGGRAIARRGPHLGGDRKELQPPLPEFLRLRFGVHDSTRIHRSTRNMPASAITTPASVDGLGISPSNRIPSRTPPVTSWVAITLTVVAGR